MTDLTSEQTNTELADSVLADSVLASALSYLRSDGPRVEKAPCPADVVQSLLAAEKRSKQEKPRYDYAQFLGTWRLGFVSGTRKVQTKAGAKSVKRPGKGRFLPRWITVKITYSADNLQSTIQVSQDVLPSTSGPSASFGSVSNSVALGPARLCLSGPTRFWPKTNSLGFDFVHLQGGVGNTTFYKGAVRGGQESLQTFATKTLKDQAFFTFFIVNKVCIAARGKGGGLALWVRSEP